MSKKKYLDKHRYSKGVQNEMDDIDYWDKLDSENSDFLKQFMYENYGNGFYQIPEDERILQTEEQLKEARRNNNNTNRDALLRAIKTGKISSADLLDYKLTQEEIDDWEDIYKYNDFEAAVFYLMEMTADELDMEFDEHVGKILCHYYLRMKKLIKLAARDRLNQRSEDE